MSDESEYLDLSSDEDCKMAAVDSVDDDVSESILQSSDEEMAAVDDDVSYDDDLPLEDDYFCGCGVDIVDDEEGFAEIWENKAARKIYLRDLESLENADYIPLHSHVASQQAFNQKMNNQKNRVVEFTSLAFSEVGRASSHGQKYAFNSKMIDKYGQKYVFNDKLIDDEDDVVEVEVEEVNGAEEAEEVSEAVQAQELKDAKPLGDTKVLDQMEKLSIRDNYIFQFYRHGLDKLVTGQRQKIRPGSDYHHTVLKILSNGDRTDALKDYKHQHQHHKEFEIIRLEKTNPLHQRIHLEINKLKRGTFFTAGQNMAALARSCTMAELASPDNV